ncbi:MAG: N-formylglutamate deformylase [Burkholderiaceae bacterium]|nr:N-formylglutamate deformylase [Burkholderiaceae bacterium]
MITADRPIFTLHRGRTPLLVSLPHVGTQVPGWLAPRLQAEALAVPDTDWHLQRLYGFVKDLGASLIVPSHSRYVVDLNRPPENAPMYPGANNTELCPTRFFTGAPLYRDGQAPDAAEVAQRVAAYWKPYHDALGGELARLKSAHGHAILFDGHSIKGELPWLFDGRLWDLNLGTANGAACTPGLQAALDAVLAGQSRYSHISNGRFKGGHITRFYGRPAEGVQAVQMEMCWHCYMDETPPFAYREDLAAQVQPVLRGLVQAMLAWQPA